MKSILWHHIIYDGDDENCDEYFQYSLDFVAEVRINKGDIETAKVNFQKVIDIAPNSEDGAQAQATLSALQ